MVDRTTGRVTPVTLPEFDPFYSDVAWYQDYAAYCGIDDTASKVFAVVMEIGRKKPILRRELSVASNGENPDSECTKPDWDQQPPHVTFHPKSAQKFTFTLPSTDMVQGSEKEHGNDQ